LTFREPITSYDIALTAWQQFLKRLRHLYENPLKYLCVWEYQKQRSVKLNIENGGIFHFHCLMNIGYIEHSKLEKIWGKGFVWIDHLSSEHKKQNAILYTTKYCVKEIVSRIENKEDIRGQRFFFTSNNLLKPKVFTMQESANLENLIIKNLENMISDGQYSMCNECGIPVNAISYIEYKK
jgi:hypothetical protein